MTDQNKVKSEKVLYGAEFGVELKKHFIDPPESPRLPNGQAPRLRSGQRSKLWTAITFAEAVGVDVRTIRNWSEGSHMPNDLTHIERALFDGKDEKHAASIQRLRLIAENCRLRRSEREPFPEPRSSFAAPSIYADTSADLATLQYVDIDRLPVDEGWKFDAIRYGEGAQMVLIGGDSLFWLSPDTPLTDGIDRRSLTEFFPEAGDELEGLAKRASIFLPRRIEIEGRKRRNAAVRFFVGTDIIYPQDIEDGDGESFTASAWLGRGGIASFVDRDGGFLTRSDVEMGEGLGCVTALVAVAYVERRPRYRTPYCLAIRKGIRYPDDGWLSPTTGKPVFSGDDPATSRFLFQSREPGGGLTDMFVADFNGGNMFNLNQTDGSAWDGFVDEAGNDLTRWNGNRITFGSTITGKGFIEPITREDRR